MTVSWQELFAEVSALPVIDTHEHLPHDEAARDHRTDVLREYLLHYLRSDLISAGMGQAEMDRVTDPERDLRERWRLVEPYWEACRHTGYGRALDLAVRAIYGIDGVTGSTIEALHAAFQRSLAPGHFRRVLKDLCGIRLSILDGFTGRFERDEDLFVRVWQPLKYIIPGSFGDAAAQAKRRYGITVRTLDDWLEAFRRELDDALQNGVIALKCSLAYHRSLHFADVGYAAARAAFAGVMAAWEREGRRSDAPVPFPPELQDYMMHHILRVAGEKRLVLQIHTGLQEGNGNHLPNSDPSLLTNLFLTHPGVRFDLFHIGYPYQGVVCALAKVFPNVHIDMCWAHIISPSASRRALDDFLDAVPYNKISAFGGDYLFVDGVYGHLHLARENVSRVLARKVEEGVFSREKALAVARALFYENPRRLFGLEDKTPA
ncbi:MAG: amidohydrolase family protein [Bacteroidota bacterium]